MFSFYDDPDLSARQLELVAKLWARHNTEYLKLVQTITFDRYDRAVKIREDLAHVVEAEAWILENAVIRGLTITEMLRLLISANTDTEP